MMQNIIETPEQEHATQHATSTAAVPCSVSEVATRGVVRLQTV